MSKTGRTLTFILSMLFLIKTGYSQDLFEKYREYDFVTGERILFEDRIGSSSVSNWIVKGGELLASSENNEGILQINQYYTVLAPNNGEFPSASEFFTIEFDSYLDSKYEGNPGVFVSFNLGNDPKAVLGTFSNYTQFDCNDSKNRVEHPKLIYSDMYYDRWHHYVMTYVPGSVRIFVDQFPIIALTGCILNFNNITFCGNSSDGMKMSFRNFRITSVDPGNIGSNLSIQEKVITHGVIYNYDNTLKPESMGTLNKIFKYMNDNPSISIEIGSYTDNSIGIEKAEEVTLKQSENICSLLVSMGINKSRLVARGYGSRFPLYDNTNEVNRANNRRVEFKRM